jgi:glycogen operon protein
MILMGDEVRRTQGGNNNAYCQDNEISWFDWSNLSRHADVFRFVSEAIRFRRTHRAFMRPEFLTGRAESSHLPPDISWYGEDGKPLDWNRDSRFLAYRLVGTHASTKNDCEPCDFYVMFNASVYDITVTIAPPLEGLHWFRAIDTSYDSPDDILPCGNEELLLNQEKYVILSRTSVVLLARKV